VTLNQAAAHFAPRGRHRGRPLACIALDDPAYLIRQAEEPDAECPAGSMFHQAVVIVAARLLQNYEADILAGRTLAPDEFVWADWCNDGTFGTGGTEANREQHRRRGRYYDERQTDDQSQMF
jgi:hypothetical protein